MVGPLGRCLWSGKMGLGVIKDAARAQKVRVEDGWGLPRSKESKSSVEARRGWREECQRNGTHGIREGEKKMVATAHRTCPTSEAHLRAGRMPLEESSLPYHQGFHNSPASRN